MDKKLVTFSSVFAKYAQTQSYTDDPAYAQAKAVTGNPSLLNDFYARYPNDVMTLAQYVDSSGQVQIDVTYNQGRYQITSPNKNIPANVMNHISSFITSRLPKPKDPSTKFTNNVFWSLSVE